MANKITWADKVALQERPDVAAENKVTAADMNQIKTAVNETIDTMPSNLVNGQAEGSIRSIGAYDKTGRLLGEEAQAFGHQTEASGLASHAEGWNTIASGPKSHVEGDSNTASGDYSHAEGNGTKASGNASHTEGLSTTASGRASHAEGYRTTAGTHYQHVQGKFNIPDTTSAHIVGNGSYGYESNAHTLDWNGNAWFAGDVYTGSRSWTNKDEGSKKLATEEFVTNLVSDAGWITSTTLSPNGVCTYNTGQVTNGLQVRKVGKIVYLNLTLSLNLGEDTTPNDQYLLILDEKYRPTQTIYFTSLLTYDLDSQSDSAASCTVSISPDGKVELLNYKEVARKQIEIGGNTLSLNQLVSYPV